MPGGGIREFSPSGILSPSFQVKFCAAACMIICWFLKLADVCMRFHTVIAADQMSISVDG